jgi:hypothetical protein
MEEVYDRCLYNKYDLIPLMKQDKEDTDRIRDHMVAENLEMIQREGGAIIKKVIVSRRFSIEDFKRDYPELYEQYRKPQVTVQIWKYPETRAQEAMRNPPPPPEFLVE